MNTLRVHILGLVLLLCAPLASAGEQDWARWLLGRLAELPANGAIQARLDADLAESRALSEPLYNPELNIGYENSAETTKTVGLSQTLDWSGKGRVGGRVGEVAGELARVRGEKAAAALTADALRALIDFDAARARLAAAREQEQRLQRLTELVRRRERSGDLGRVDATLAYLSMARVQQALADAESAATAATVVLRERLAVAAPGRPLPDADRWRPQAGEPDAGARLAHSYELRLAERQLSLAERASELARKEKRGDPTLGLRAGREGGENLWGLDFSLPLPLFNTGAPEYQAALAGAERRRALLEKTRNDLLARLEGALTDYRQRRQRWQQWQDLAGAPLADSGDLLEQVWRQGELTTQDYLRALDERLRTRLAGVELRQAMQRAWVHWLYQSAGLSGWLRQLAGARSPATEATAIEEGTTP